jgi:hypothetical protein
MPEGDRQIVQKIEQALIKFVNVAGPVIAKKLIQTVEGR